MNKKLIGAEPYFCEKCNKDVILEVFEDEIITDAKISPIKILQFTECLSFGSVPDCEHCRKTKKYES